MGVASNVILCNMALGYAGINKPISTLLDPSAQAGACNTYYIPYLRQMLSEFHWPWATRRQILSPYAGPTWSASVAYTVGQLVAYGDNVYRCLLASTGNEPDISGTQWYQVTRDGWDYCCPLPNDYISAMQIWESPIVNPLAVTQIWDCDASDYRGNLSIRSSLSADRLPFDFEDADDGSGNQVLLTDLDTPVLKYTAYVDNTNSFSDKFVDAFSYKLAAAFNAILRSDPNAAATLAKMSQIKLGEAISDANRNKQEDPEPESEFEAARHGRF